MTRSILYSNHHPKPELSSQYPFEDVTYLINISTGKLPTISPDTEFWFLKACIALSLSTCHLQLELWTIYLESLSHIMSVSLQVSLPDPAPPSPYHAPDWLQCTS